eukprot:CAMPEP_0113274880 /NCGR_PEP_ID=MMETSP0008_2-20120614/24642_1 /TAXON_ID=97485 /ORGANISM="Prymnesium parvum" /LENGTH=165 /DNA_ID=CAMNT_0000124537 /DNA_START=41 /DNA_END=535 /DNA_ORIENTATION=+ /assembly_acc=CAM_ASM_000153
MILAGAFARRVLRHVQLAHPPAAYIGDTEAHNQFRGVRALQGGSVSMSKRMFFDQCVLVCDNLASVATTLQTSFPHLAHESAAMLRAAGPSWTLLTLLEWCTAVVVTETFVECSDERIELLRTQLRRLTIATDFVHMATEVALSLRAHGRACRPYGEAFAAHCAA